MTRKAFFQIGRPEKYAMKTQRQKPFKNEFEADVFAGLSATPKYLNSKYFYDARGDALFQQIMELSDYYLSEREFEILRTHQQKIAELFAAGGGFDLIEFGAGDGQKTKILLQHLHDRGVDFKYCPVDISKNAVEKLRENLHQTLPDLRVEPHIGTYEQVLKKLGAYRGRKKVILFLGSNIGNFTAEAAVSFLGQIRAQMGREDLLFVGFDQKKHPQKILNAYNDPEGVTEAFNKNLLLRINRELGAYFDPDAFVFWPVYDPEESVLKSYLLSKTAQNIRIEALDFVATFHPWESIHMENSRKFDAHAIQSLARQAGLLVSRVFADPQNNYKDYLFKKSPEDERPCR